MPEEDEKEDNKVILKVDMHCEACKAKVRKSLRDFPGLENIDINMKEQKVTVKGKVDVKKVFDRLKKKCGKRTELLFPQLKDQEKKTQEEEKQEPPEVVVLWKVKMHCGGCAREVKKALQKMDGVCDVKVDLVGEKIIVKGKNVDPKKICDKVVEKTGKEAEILPSPMKSDEKDDKAEEKKDDKVEEKKEEEKTDEKNKEEEKADEKKKEEEKADEKKEEEKADEKPEEKADEKPEEEKADEKLEEKADEKKEEEKQEEKAEESETGDANVKKEEGNDVMADEKKSENTPMKSVPEYVYPPQLFSDENPNACCIM